MQPFSPYEQKTPLKYGVCVINSLSLFWKFWSCFTRTMNYKGNAAVTEPPCMVTTSKTKLTIMKTNVFIVTFLSLQHALRAFKEEHLFL